MHAALIYALSSQPLVLSGVHFPHLDKLAHALIFGAFAYLLAWGLFAGWPALSTGRVLTVTLMCAVAWGALDELHQRYVPFRQSDPLDLLADATGALLVVAGWWVWRRTRPACAVAEPDV